MAKKAQYSAVLNAIVSVPGDCARVALSDRWLLPGHVAGSVTMCDGHLQVGRRHAVSGSYHRLGPTMQPANLGSPVIALTGTSIFCASEKSIQQVAYVGEQFEMIGRKRRASRRGNGSA
jgi:hypothetical protein